MRKLFIVISFCFSALFAFANDGVFYAAGNQLISITETDISVKKEVLVGYGLLPFAFCLKSINPA